MGGFLTSVVDHIVGAVEGVQQKANEEASRRAAEKWASVAPPPPAPELNPWAQAYNAYHPDAPYGSPESRLLDAVDKARQITQPFRDLNQYGQMADIEMRYGPPANPSPQYLYEQSQLPDTLPQVGGRKLAPVEQAELGFTPQNNSQWLKAVVDPIGTVAGLAAQGITRATAPITGPIDRALPERLQGPAEAAGHLAAGALAYAPLLPLGPAAAGVIGAQQTAMGIAQPAGQYSAGLISGKEALTAAGLNAVMALAPFVAAKGIEWLRSPEAADLLNKLAPPEERARIVQKLQSERGGSLGGKPPEGGEPRPAGDLLPPEAVSQAGEMVPPENQLLLQTLQETMPSRQQRAAQLMAGRGRQFGERKAAIDTATTQGKTPEEALTAGQQGMSGAILDRPDALRGRFSDEHVQSYYGQILDGERNQRITAGESIAAKNGLDRLMNGTRHDGTANPVMPHEAEAMSRVFGPEFLDALPTTPEGMSIFDKVMAPLQLIRSFKTAFDDSFGLGQGWKEIPVNFRGWWKGTKEVKAMLSDENLAAAMEKLRNESPTYVRGQSVERPLGIMETGGGPRAAEEFLSPVTKKIPLMNVSERRFVARGNIIRQTGLDAMNRMWETANPGQQVPDDLFQLMVDIENHSTGWGNLKALGKYQSILTQTLFSARGKTALAQYPTDLVRAALSGDATLRKIAATRLATWIAMNGAILASANVAGQAMGIGGADINPLSTQFGQIKFGPQKIDIWQGYSPIARAFIQTVKGERQRPGHIATEGINRFKPGDAYVRNQLSPLASIVYDVAIGQGRNAAGKPVMSRDYWYNQFVPLFIGDTVESLKLMGVAGVPGAVASFEGLRVNTYEPNESPEQIAKANAETQLKDAGYDPDAKAWEKLKAAKGIETDADSLKDYFDEKYESYKAKNPGFPEQVLKKRWEEGSIYRQYHNLYDTYKDREQLPFERNPKTRKLLLQAGKIEPKTAADERLLMEPE